MYNEIEISEFKTKVEAIAKILKYDVITFSEYRGLQARLKENKDVNSKEMCLRVLEYGNNKGKLHISGVYPKYNYQHIDIWINKEDRILYNCDTYGRLFDKDINISYKKTVEKIAKEIENRFLPDYRLYYIKVIEKIKELEAEENKRKCIISDVAKELNLEVNYKYNDKEKLYINLKDKFSYLYIESNHKGNCIKFPEFEVVKEKAIKILKILIE